MKLLLINVYFGPYPLWFPAFLISCQYNPEVDWFLVTDNTIPIKYPQNINFLQLSPGKFSKLASNKLGLSIDIGTENAFKLVDLKIGYGKIFEDYCSNYDFWGICDIDTIWGNIKKYISESILMNYDIISSRKKKISGHFTLFKNHTNLSNFILAMPAFGQFAESKNIYILDERYLTPYLKDMQKRSMLHKIRNWITRREGYNIYWKKYLTITGKDQKNIPDDIHDAFVWEQGNTFNRKNKEIMYLHFHLLKKSISKINFKFEDSPKKFVVTPTKIWAI